MMQVIKKMQMLAMLALALVPLVLVEGLNAFPERLWLCAVMPSAYWLLGMLCTSFRGRKRLWIGLLCAVALLAVGVGVMPWREAWWTLTLPVAYTALLLYTLPIGGWVYEAELPYPVTLCGCLLYVVLQLYQMLQPVLTAPISTALIWCFLVYGALWMLSLERTSLREAANNGRRANDAMRRKNRIFTIGLMILIVLIAAIPALAEALAWAWERLKEVLMIIAEWLLALIPGGTTASGGGGGGGGLGDLGLPAGESAPWLKALEKVLQVVVVIALVVIAVVVGRILWRKLKVLFGKLWTLLNRFALAASEDYVDEVADTRETGEAASILRRNPFTEWMKQVNEERMSPVERIRYRYQRLIRKHSEWQPGSTARETLPVDAAVLYERARYTDKPITAEEAEAFAQQAKAMEKH